MCVRHGKQCQKKRSPHAYSCGYSCKDFSRQGIHQLKHRCSLANLDPDGGTSVRTFAGNYKYMCKARPMLSDLENVEAVDDHVVLTPGADIVLVKDSNLDMVEQLLADAEFCCFSMLLDSSDYGLPQGRRRYHTGVVPKEHMEKLICWCFT